MMGDLTGARLRSGALVAVPGAAQTHQAGDLLQQLLRRAELFRIAGGSRDASEFAGIRTGEACDDCRICPERYRIAGRERLVVLRNGQILVHHRAALEDDVADDRSFFDTDRHRHGAGRIGKLAAQPAEYGRLAVTELVVDRGPAVPLAGHDTATRPAKTRHVLSDRLLHRALVVSV